MGQPVSKNAQGNMSYAPFENYQGPMAAPGGLVTAQYPPPGGRVVSIDDREQFWDGDPVYVPDAQPPPRTARGNFGPPGMPRRRGPFGPSGPQDVSVTQGPGYASALRDQMMVEAENAPWYRSAPPQSRSYQPPPQSRQPNVKTVRTVINEPRGYAPPGAQGQSQGYQVQSQQASSQPTHVMYYDPKTGALSSSGQQYSAPTGPVSCGTQSCAAPQAYHQPQVAYQQQPQVAYQQQPQVAYQQPQVAYQQPQVAYQQPQQMMAQPQMFGYQQAAQPMAYAYPQQQQMTQPIVVPGQLYTANGGVQQLG